MTGITGMGMTLLAACNKWKSLTIAEKLPARPLQGHTGYKTRQYLTGWEGVGFVGGWSVGWLTSLGLWSVRTSSVWGKPAPHFPTQRQSIRKSLTNLRGIYVSCQRVYTHFAAIIKKDCSKKALLESVLRFEALNEKVIISFLIFDNKFRKFDVYM